MGLMDPTAEGDTVDLKPLSPRVDGLEGNCIGLVTNGKFAAEPILAEVRQVLEDRFDDISFSFEGVEELNKLKDDAVLDRIERWAEEDPDVAITAYGDCGSCTKFLTWATNRIENAGVPAVGLCDEGFVLDWKSNSTELGRNLRYKTTPVRCETVEVDIIKRKLTPDVVEEIIEELTRPLSEGELPPEQVKS